MPRGFKRANQHKLLAQHLRTKQERHELQRVTMDETRDFQADSRRKGAKFDFTGAGRVNHVGFCDSRPRASHKKRKTRQKHPERTTDRLSSVAEGDE